jgi:hypothetical protein
MQTVRDGGDNETGSHMAAWPNCRRSSGCGRRRGAIGLVRSCQDYSSNSKAISSPQPNARVGLRARPLPTTKSTLDPSTCCTLLFCSYPSSSAPGHILVGKLIPFVGRRCVMRRRSGSRRPDTRKRQPGHRFLTDCTSITLLGTEHLPCSSSTLAFAYWPQLFAFTELC